MAFEVLSRCDEAASFTEEVGKVTRTFLSEPMLRMHERLAGWMEAAGLLVHSMRRGTWSGDTRVATRTCRC